MPPWFLSARTLSTLALVALSLVVLFACASHEKENAPLAAPAWRLVPEAIVTNQKRQFFLYGRHLDRAEISVPPSVHYEKGDLKPDGRVLSLYLTVSPLVADSVIKGEKNGIREISIKTQDTTAVFTVKVVDEAQPR